MQHDIIKPIKTQKLGGKKKDHVAWKEELLALEALLIPGYAEIGK